MDFNMDFTLVILAQVKFDEHQMCNRYRECLLSWPYLINDSEPNLRTNLPVAIHVNWCGQGCWCSHLINYSIKLERGRNINHRNTTIIPSRCIDDSYMLFSISELVTNLHGIWKKKIMLASDIETTSTKNEIYKDINVWLVTYVEKICVS